MSTADGIDTWMSKNASPRERGTWRRLQGVPMEELTVEERAALDDVVDRLRERAIDLIEAE